MPIIEITLIEGRTREQKLTLMREVTSAVERSLDVKPETIRVILREIPPAHFAVGGVPKG